MIISEVSKVKEKMSDDGGYGMLYNMWEDCGCLYYRGIFIFLVLVEYLKTKQYFVAGAACIIAGLFLYGVIHDPIVMFVGMVVAFLLFVLLFRPR